MGEGIEWATVALRLIGVFYVFAGVVATRAALNMDAMDRMIAAIGAARPPILERAQALWHIAAAQGILAGGLALVLLLDVSLWLFVLSLAIQSLYLYLIAPRVFDPANPPDPNGRRQTQNAFAAYAVATAAVAWGAAAGKLLGWRDLPGPALSAAAVVLVHATHAIWRFVRPVVPRGR